MDVFAIMGCPKIDNPQPVIYHKTMRGRRFCPLILLIICVILGEYWVHFHDNKNGYGVLHKKMATPYILASILPIKNMVNDDNIEIKLPYGYKLIDAYSSVGIFNSEKSWNNFYDEMNTKFEYMDQLGSSTLWIDTIHNKTIWVNHIRRGGIFYLTINIDDYIR